MKRFLPSLKIAAVLFIAAAALLSCNLGEDMIQQYTIVVTDDGNGSAYADAMMAGAGTPVVLTATPAANYMFSKWTVLSGSATIDSETENPATFTMPEGDVIIMAEFVIDPATIEYTITVTSGGNGSAIASVGAALSGTEITLTAAANTEYMFSKWTVVSGDVVLSSETANPATFTMPAGNVEIKAEFETFNGFAFMDDLTFKIYCEQFDTQPDGILSQAEAGAVTEINVGSSSPAIWSLAGIEIFTNLIHLDCGYNNLSAEAIRNIFASLPDRQNLSLGHVTVAGNPGSAEITYEDRKVATDKNWVVNN